MRTHAWTFDETAHAGPEHLDPAYVSAYDRKAGTDPGEDVGALRELGLNDTHTLIDVGAGTGAFALAVAPFCRRVIAVDVSRIMLDSLREKAARLDMRNIEPVQAGFLSYEHAGDPVDFAYSRNALHHLPDFWKALALERTAGIMQTGGILFLRDLVYAFEPGEAAAVFGSWLNGAAQSSDHGWTRAELETHIRDEYSTFSWLLEPMLERAGFAILAVSHDPRRVYSAYTCVKR